VPVTTAEPVESAAPIDAVLVEDPLVEKVSIDGTRGVY
jgi:mycofactocin precursor